MALCENKNRPEYLAILVNSRTFAPDKKSRKKKTANNKQTGTIRNRTKMKKILIMAIVAMMTAVSANAQSELSNEISVAYGGGANSDIVSSIAKGMFTGEQLSYWGPVSLEYFHYNEGGRAAFGAVAAASGCKWDDDSNAKSTYITLMPAFKYKWVNSDMFGLYSKAAVGATLMKDSSFDKDESRVMFNWQLSLLGLEFGSSIRAFAEVGMGEQGIVLGGVRVRF